MPLEIKQFSLGWHPQTGSAYRIMPEGRGWSNWINVSSSDLSALAAIFAEQPVFIHPNGSITTGPEPVGD